LRAGELAGVLTADPVPAVSEGLLALVDRLCGASQVVLVVDDLHWADEASLLVWHRLNRMVPQLPLLLVTACRPVPRRAEVVQLRRRVLAAGGELLTLEPLPVEPVDQMVCDLLAADAIGAALQRAVAQAAGNPLYVREMVAALDRERLLHTGDGTVDLTADDASGVPVSLVAAISDRLGFVSPGALADLRAAALLGIEFSITDLAALLGRPASELAPMVYEAMQAGVLAESGVRLAFRHPLIRQVLHDGIPPALRSALHHQAARGLAGTGAAPERVAQHLLGALAEIDEARAVDFWALDWLAGHGPELAHRSPKVAAELLGEAVPRLSAGDPRLEQLQTVLASALVMLGRREEAAQLAEHIHTTTADPDRAAETTWTMVWALQGVLHAGTVLGETLARPDLGAVWRVRLRALQVLLAVSTGASEQEPVALAVLAEAERLGDRLAAATGAHALFVIYFHRGDAAGSAAAIERVLPTLGDGPATADLRLILLQDRLTMLGSADRLAEADDAVRELLAAAERRASPQRLAANRCLSADYYYQAGHWDEAIAVLESLEEDPRPLAPYYGVLRHGVWALIAAHRDDEPGVSAHLAAAAELPLDGESANYAQYLAMAGSVLAERQGDAEQALSLLAGLLDPGQPVLTDRRLWLPVLTRLAVARGAAATARAAAAAADDDAASGPTASRTAAAEHCRGLLDADPVVLLAGAERLRIVGRPVELATVLEDAAVVLAEHGDLPGARTAYAEAVECFTALGADGDLRRVASRLRPYGIRLARSRRPATGWAALTPSELTVANLVADGHSNPDIAAHLFLSRRTVDVHVSHILAKLAVRSRVDIAREAIKHQPAGARAR
jgi:DNA-binding CsgD family transcriptional regulator/tetratricopeptide (TPR) repeat protein